MFFDSLSLLEETPSSKESKRRIGVFSLLFPNALFSFLSVWTPQVLGKTRTLPHFAFIASALKSSSHPFCPKHVA